VSSELLRRAAKEMRDERGHFVAGQPATFWDALADWLDRVATALETDDPEDVLGFGEPSDARAVARAYLGGAS
jgi:hypothetical protein